MAVISSQHNADSAAGESLQVRLEKSCHDNDVTPTVLCGKEFTSQVPFMSLPDDCAVVWEKQAAGHISPRRLVQAQIVLSRRGGCHVICDVVTAIKEDHDKQCIELHLEYHAPLYAKSVILATGSASKYVNIFPGNLSLAATGMTQTVLLVEVSDEQAKEFAAMPSLLLDDVWPANKESDLHFHHAYILPPIRYPDGRFYLKIGHGKVYDYPVRDFDAYRRWYCGSGLPEAASLLERVLQLLLPTLRPLSLKTDTCVTMVTPSGQVYVDRVPGVSCGDLFVATGGNGGAAKSSDEIGLVAAKLATARAWSYDLPADTFKAHWSAKKVGAKL